MGLLIAAQNVSRVYQSDGTSFAAVIDVSLAVEAGEFLALMGPSGCGKSTLLNILGGIDRPDSGAVHVAGTRIDSLTETQSALFRRRHVGIVFQFFNLIHNLDVRDNIELPGLLAGLPAREAHARADELMATLGISDLAQKLPGRLSGGQRQRVAIARALINRPAVLLADEPTGALDVESGQSVLRLFRQIHAQGQTIVMVTHDPKVSGHAERILMMQDGRLVDEVRPSGVLPAGLLGLRARGAQ
jgi:putative ABC transport system ATP-binding protein